MNKEEFLTKETEKLNAIISKSLELHHIRQEWVANNCDYVDSGKAFPDSVLKFTEIYFEGLNKAINHITEDRLTLLKGILASDGSQP